MISKKDIKTKRNNKHLINLIKNFKDSFYNSYKIDNTVYLIKLTNEVIFNEKSKLVAKFKDFLILYDDSEFLKRFYNSFELKDRLKKIYLYYNEYSKIFPNYIVLSEAKYIYKNIQRKQRMIDNQQILELKENKKNKNCVNRNTNTIKKLDNDNNYSKDIFNTEIYNSILNVSCSYLILNEALIDSACKKNVVNNMNYIDNDNENENVCSNNINNRIDVSVSSIKNLIDIIDGKKKSKLVNKINLIKNFGINKLLNNKLSSLSKDKKTNNIQINLAKKNDLNYLSINNDNINNINSNISMSKYTTNNNFNKAVDSSSLQPSKIDKFNNNNNNTMGKELKDTITKIFNKNKGKIKNCLVSSKINNLNKNIISNDKNTLPSLSPLRNNKDKLKKTNNVDNSSSKINSIAKNINNDLKDNLKENINIKYNSKVLTYKKTESRKDKISEIGNLNLKNIVNKGSLIPPIIIPKPVSNNKSSNKSGCRTDKSNNSKKNTLNNINKIIDKGKECNSNNSTILLKDKIIKNINNIDNKSRINNALKTISAISTKHNNIPASNNNNNIVYVFNQNNSNNINIYNIVSNKNNNNNNNNNIQEKSKRKYNTIKVNSIKKVDCINTSKIINKKNYNNVEIDNINLNSLNKNIIKDNSSTNIFNNKIKLNIDKDKVLKKLKEKNIVNKNNRNISKIINNNNNTSIINSKPYSDKNINLLSISNNNNNNHNNNDNNNNNNNNNSITKNNLYINNNNNTLSPTETHNKIILNRKYSIKQNSAIFNLNNINNDELNNNSLVKTTFRSNILNIKNGNIIKHNNNNYNNNNNYLRNSANFNSDFNSKLIFNKDNNTVIKKVLINNNDSITKYKYNFKGLNNVNSMKNIIKPINHLYNNTENKFKTIDHNKESTVIKKPSKKVLNNFKMCHNKTKSTIV